MTDLDAKLVEVSRQYDSLQAELADPANATQRDQLP